MTHFSVLPDCEGNVTSRLTLWPPGLLQTGVHNHQTPSQISFSFLKLLLSQQQPRADGGEESLPGLPEAASCEASSRPPPPWAPCSPVLVVLHILGQVYIEDDEVVHVAAGKGLPHLTAPRLAGPLPHANQGIVCDVGGRLNVLHDVLQRDVPL